MYPQPTDLPTLGVRLTDALTWVIEVINSRAEALEARSLAGSTEDEKLRFLAAGLRMDPVLQLWPRLSRDLDLIRSRFAVVRIDLERRLRALAALDGKEQPPGLVVELNRLTREMGVWPWIP